MSVSCAAPHARAVRRRANVRDRLKERHGGIFIVFRYKSRSTQTMIKPAAMSGDRIRFWPPSRLKPARRRLSGRRHAGMIGSRGVGCCVSLSCSGVLDAPQGINTKDAKGHQGARRRPGPGNQAANNGSSAEHHRRRRRHWPTNGLRNRSAPPPWPSVASKSSVLNPYERPVGQRRHRSPDRAIPANSISRSARRPNRSSPFMG